MSTTDHLLGGLPTELGERVIFPDPLPEGAWIAVEDGKMGDLPAGEWCVKGWAAYLGGSMSIDVVSRDGEARTVICQPGMEATLIPPGA